MILKIEKKSNTKFEIPCIFMIFFHYLKKKREMRPELFKILSHSVSFLSLIKGYYWATNESVWPTVVSSSTTRSMFAPNFCNLMWKSEYPRSK